MSLFNTDVRFKQSREERIASLNNQPNLDFMLSSAKEQISFVPARAQDNFVHVERDITKEEDSDEIFERPILQIIMDS